jgi:predicted ATP-dependent serine protease
MTDPVRLTPRSFSSLAELPTEPAWLWDKLLGPQQLTMLAGRSFAGKSTLVMGLLAALSSGRPFLDLPTNQATALLLTEQNPYALSAQAAQFGCLESGHEFLSRDDGLSAHHWPVMLEQATERAVDAGHQLLVLDAFASLAGLEGEQENHAAAVTNRLRVLQDAASYGLAVLLLHHTGNNGQVRGSTAFKAVVDISTTLTRGDNQKQLTLRTQSRFPAPQTIHATLTTEGDTSSYQTTNGHSTSKAKEDIDERIIRRVAEDTTGEGMDRKTIAQTDEITEDMLKKRIPRLVNEGRLVERMKGKKGQLSRYSTP